MLVRFKIVSVDEKESEYTYQKGFDFKHNYKAKRYDYTIHGDDGNEYQLYDIARPILGLHKGVVIFAHVYHVLREGLSMEAENGKYQIKWGRGTDNYGMMTARQFHKAVIENIESCHKNIEANQSEITRLEALMK
jgi:hypothetical protein